MGQCDLMRPQDGVCENEEVIIPSPLRANKPLITLSPRTEKKVCVVDRSPALHEAWRQVDALGSSVC